MKKRICQKCKRELSQLQVKNGRGVYVFYNKLTRDERISLRIGIPVPYDESEHKSIIHNNFCDGLIPHCRRCGEKIGFIQVNENRYLPILFKDLTKEEKYLLALGKPIEYRSEHKNKLHINKCEVKQRWTARKSARKLTVK